MAIDKFSREKFEAALPKLKPVGDAPAVSLARSLGIVQGEYCYIIHPFPKIPVGLFIRSSVDYTGYAADTGEDSIRVLWCALEGDTYEIIGNKAKAYTTRVKGWEERLTKLLRKLANTIKWCQPCPKCGKLLTPYTTKKGDNAGRCFVSCNNCRHPNGNSSVFYWTEDENEEPNILPQSFWTKKVAAIQCPNCHRTESAGVSAYPQNGSHHCFRKKGGCGHCWTPNVNDGLTTPAKEAPNAVEIPQPPKPKQTLAELVALVETMVERAHEAEDANVFLRSAPECEAVALFIRKFHG